LSDSSHFHAGADNRLKNQQNPDGRHVNGGDNNFDPTATSGLGPNYTLKPGDFPFHQLADPTNRDSKVIFDSNDVASSQGTFAGDFNKVVGAGEDCTPRALDSFTVGGKLLRKVEPRNTPTTINAVFNYRNFWDGRANNIFNGVNPFGPRDTGATVLQVQADGSTQPVKVALNNSSLASQAVGPALSDFEMSCSNKTFKDIARKLFATRPLAKQQIHAGDSVLAAYRDPSGIGLKSGYADMIKAAFDPSWWSSADSFAGYSQMEQNFSLFWGLAIQAYEATLVSDQTPLDKYLGSVTTNTPGDKTALTALQQRGLDIFSGKGACTNCHLGAELTSAASRLQQDAAKGALLTRMAMGDGGIAIYDKGFYNIGVRPTPDDIGVGGTDAFGNPLSFSREYIQQLSGGTVFDPLVVNPCSFDVLVDPTNCSTAPPPSQRVAADGAFKVPTLRNVALTQPYFHNGGQFSLEQVVAFYSRGGDVQRAPGGDTSGFVDPSASNGSGSNLDANIKRRPR
jgi:cytochrome c peroxidase